MYEMAKIKNGDNKHNNCLKKLITDADLAINNIIKTGKKNSATDFTQNEIPKNAPLSIRSARKNLLINPASAVDNNTSVKIN